MKKQVTTLLIRPAARGGKYLCHDAANSEIHSALISIMHVETGEFIDYGLAYAPNANSAGPKDLMNPVSRSIPFAVDDDTVHVKLCVAISEPTDFRVLVFGPLSYPDQARLALADIIVLPGIDIGANPQYPEGLVIEVPGLCISNVTDGLHVPQLSCSAKVTMMCGCPIGNEVDWFCLDTDFFVTLVIRMQSKEVYCYPMEFVSTPNLNINSLFAGQWLNKAPNDPVEEAWMSALEPKLGNQGKFKMFPSQAMPMLPPEVQNMLGEARCRLV